MEIKQGWRANMADKPETWETSWSTIKPGRTREHIPACWLTRAALTGRALCLLFLTFAVCSGLRRLDRSRWEWLLFELNIYSSEMRVRELTNTESICREIVQYYLPFISLLIPIHTSSVHIIIKRCGSIRIDRLSHNDDKALGCYEIHLWRQTFFFLLWAMNLWCWSFTVFICLY